MTDAFASSRTLSSRRVTRSRPACSTWPTLEYPSADAGPSWWPAVLESRGYQVRARVARRFVTRYRRWAERGQAVMLCTIFPNDGNQMFKLVFVRYPRTGGAGARFPIIWSSTATEVPTAFVMSTDEWPGMTWRRPSPQGALTRRRVASCIQKLTAQSHCAKRPSFSPSLRSMRSL